MPLLSRARPLTDTLTSSVRSVDRTTLLILALMLGTLAQAILTPRPGLLVGGLVLLGVLLILSSFLARGARSVRSQGTASIVLLAALIGGGLLFHFLSSFGAAIPLYVASVLLFLLVQPRRSESPQRNAERWQAWELILLCSIVGLGFFLQAYRVADIPPGFHGDEAESGLQALQILNGEVQSLISVGWYHLPMMSFAWPAVSMAFLGDTIFGLRMSSVIIGTLTLIAFYPLVRLLFDRTTALLATFLLAVSHPFIALNRLGINYTHTTLFQVVSFYFLFRGLRSRKWWDFAASGLFLGAGLYLYYASRLVPFIVLGFLACAALAQRGFLQRYWRGIAVLLLAATVIFAPMGAYFVGHPWHFMSRTLHVFALGDQGWVDTAYPQSNPASTLLAQAARVLPLFNYGGDTSGQYGYKGPMLDFVTSVLFVLGIAYSTARCSRPRHLFLLIWFWATLIVGGMLTLPAPFVPRLAGILPVPCIFAALALRGTADVFRESWGLRRSTNAVIGVSLALVLGTAAVLNYRTYFSEYLQTIQGWAMREPATAIARYVDSLGEEWHVYLLGEPKLYIRHGTIRFIARDLEGTDLFDVDRYVPLRTTREKNAVFVLLPSHLHHLGTLHQYYPGGVLRNFTRPSGELWFTAFEIDAEDIAAALGKQEPAR
jgi:4-amino-4-deoxy-L-arabinose transferase-like glycosyltransferase